ncbi:MAG: ABC transporter permease [Gemmatimonadota bacterium]
MVRLSWFLARRYLASRKRGRLLSFITWIALGGITVGVTALIVVIGVMDGMQKELQDKILGATPHLVVLERGNSLRMSGWRDIAVRVQENTSVQAVTPFALTKVMVIRGADFAQALDLYGFDLGAPPEEAATETEAELRRQLSDLEATEGELPPVVLGELNAARMGLFPGDTIFVIAVENMGFTPMGTLSPAIRRWVVAGTFGTGMYDYDMNNAYAPLEQVQSLLGMRTDDQVSGLGVRIVDPWVAEDVGIALQAELGPLYYTESWITTNQSLFSALRLEKLAMGVILFLIVIVAAFNIVSTLVMVVVDRTSEIGILKSMGMSDPQVLRVFVLQGFAIGVLGTFLGTSFGLILSWILDRYEIIRIPPDIYFIERLPVSVDPVDIAIIVGGSLLISLVATIYPALQASRLEPVEAIKHE